MIFNIVDGVSVLMSDEDEAAYKSQQSDFEFQSHSVRSRRGFLLSETDWRALSDNTLTPEWATYRQALRDITGQAGFPYSVVWPTKPE